MGNHYYFDHLSKDEQAVYYAMYHASIELMDSYQIPKISYDRFSEISFLMRLDHPEVFWIEGNSAKAYSDSSNMIIEPNYLFEKGKIREHQKAMKARVEKLARPMKDKAELEKEQFIHDFICQNVHYDKLKKAYSHEIIGPLGQGVGVCEGIAKAVKILCDELGIWCMIALCGNNPEEGIKYRHTWNIIRIGGKYYHLDATFDNTLSAKGELRYDYFNIDDKAIFRDHEPLIAPAPKCEDASRSYYREKKLSFTKPEDVYKRALQAAKKGKPLTFHWRGGYLTPEVFGEIHTEIYKAGKEKGKYPMVSVNWGQAVIHLQYVEDPGEEEVVTEEVNEGEKED